MCLVCKQLRLAPGAQEDDDGVPAFLAKAMNAPHEKSVSNALDLLVDLGAMQADSNDLTTLGECLAVLSLEPRVGKMMIWSYLLGCSRVAANMCVAMTTKSPFVLPRENQRRVAEAAKVQLSKGSESDQLTVHFALETKGHMKNRDTFLDFCRRSFINGTTMQMISDLRRNLSRELNRLSFADPTRSNQAQNRHDKEPALWQAAIAAGLYPNIASRTSGQSNFTTMDKHKVRIHVSSVNAAKGQPLNQKCAVRKDEIEFVCFGEIVKGDRLFTANQTTHLVSPLPLLLLCGTQLYVRPKQQQEDEDPDGCGTNGSSTTAILSVDDWIVFECDATMAGQLVILRRRLNSAFWNTIAQGSLDGLTALERDAVHSLGNVLISAHRSAA
jgi:ATP-dependent RNA helicase YTHDC2